MDVIKHGARGICGIGGMHLAAGQLPDHKAINRAKQKIAVGRARTGTVHMVQYPRKLGA